jgi:hypothetical protein
MDNDIKQILEDGIYQKYEKNTLKLYADLNGDTMYFIELKIVLGAQLWIVNTCFSLIRIMKIGFNVRSAKNNIA